MSKSDNMAKSGDTHFDSSTPDEVKRILSAAMHTGRRLRLFYGDAETGRDWAEENGTLGYIGRSTGSKKVLLLLARRDSTGGGAILTGSIVKIMEGRRTLYEHPTYHYGDYELRGSNVIRDGRIEARFKSPEQAIRYVGFMRGDRHSK